MNNKFLNVFIIIIVLLSGLLIIYLNNKDNITSKKLEAENKKVHLYLSAKELIEGKYLWDLNLLSKQIFADSLSYKEDSYKIFFWYDSVGCSRCYDFHLYNIKNSFGEDRSVIIYNGEFSFMKKDFNKAKFINCTNKKQVHKQLVLLVNNMGRILYADFPQYEQLDSWGTYFYQVSANYH